MDSEEAQALLLLTAAKESDFRVRDQDGGGPARGIFQIEATADNKGQAF